MKSCMLNVGVPLILWLTQVANSTQIDGDIQKSTRIFGGRQALKDEIPYAVFFNTTLRNVGHFCGGSIYSKNFIITAAHCFWTAPLDTVKVIAGALDETKLEDAQVIGIKKVASHELSKKSELPFDIAIVELQEPLKFNGAVQPIPIAMKGEVSSGKAVVSGFGRTLFYKHGGPAPTNRSHVLLTAEVTIIPRPECERRYRKVKQKHVIGLKTATGKGVDAPEMTNLCAGGKVDRGRGPCKGDSGGPLQCSRKVGGEVEKYLCGIVVGGYGCGTKLPEQYTEVAQFHDWIVQHTEESPGIEMSD